ncbi:uncharacterized protein [Pocillopora verrucosa]|uniref:uncharacterized protein isoform X2 n=1 Tax=Pocillopora verrucosa TaxID=203993 RepID=UPI003340D0ED
MANSNSNANDQDRFVSTDRDDLMDTFSQFLILDLEVPDDTPTMQTRMLAQVIFESQQMRSQGEMETIPVQPSWLMDSSVVMVNLGYCHIEFFQTKTTRVKLYPDCKNFGEFVFCLRYLLDGA